MHDDDDFWQWLRAAVLSFLGWLARGLIKMALVRAWTWLSQLVAGRGMDWWCKVASVPLVFVASFVTTWEIREFASYETVIIYRTGAELPQTHVLPDGSRLTVDAYSNVLIRMTHWSRDVEVGSGRIEMNVAPGWRPLTVPGFGMLNLEHFGTSFSLQNYLGKGEPTIVTVETGKLRVAERCPTDGSGKNMQFVVTAGYQAVVPSPCSGLLPELRVLSRAEMSRELAWTRGLLVFSDTPLQDALDQANRYFPRRLQLTDASLTALRISGTLRSQSMETTLKSLDTIYGIVPVPSERGLSDPGQILLGRRQVISANGSRSNRHPHPYQRSGR
ncbi:MAG TPA: FecR domain-containing protein [Steroidobacteraceae bacterium]|jgi:transmembrane sensor